MEYMIEKDIREEKAQLRELKKALMKQEGTMFDLKLKIHIFENKIEDHKNEPIAIASGEVYGKNKKGE